MAQPFDIDELRANIGEDNKAAERMLLYSFADSCGESLALLKEKFPAHEDAEYNQLWKRHTHQIKGAAMNICAANLTSIALNAQNQFEAASAAKKALLESLLLEYQAVKAHIRELHPG